MLLVLAMKKSSVLLAGKVTTVNFAVNVLTSGMRFSQYETEYSALYYVALNSEPFVSSVRIRIFSPKTYKALGVIYRQPTVTLRYCNIVVSGMNGSEQVSYVRFSERVTIIYSQIVFRDSKSVGIPVLTSEADLTVVRDDDGDHIYHKGPDTPYSGIPCTECVLNSLDLNRSCFSCTVGFVEKNGSCECSYEDSEFNETARECYHRYTDTIFYDNHTYFATCLSNTQITVNFTKATYTAGAFTLLQNDDCGISNLYINGMVKYVGTYSEITGLIRYMTRNTQNIYSSLDMIGSTTVPFISGLATRIANSITVQYITMNGNVSLVSSIVANNSYGGIAGAVNPGLVVQISHVRFIGYNFMTQRKRKVSFAIGENNGSKLTINDLLITQLLDIDITRLPISPQGIDDSQIVFECKDAASSRRLKDSMKLKTLFQQYNFEGNQTKLGYNIFEGGGLVGHSFDGDLLIYDVIVSMFVNGSTRGTALQYSMGLLVGVLNQSSITVYNAYVNGSVVCNQRNGVIGDILDSTLNITVAGEYYLSGLKHGGVLGYMVNSTVTEMLVALYLSVDSYEQYTGIIGYSMNSNITINEAIGWIDNAGSHSTYIGAATNTLLNGVLTGSNVDEMPGGKMNNC